MLDYLLQEIFYGVVVIWGIAKGALIANLLSTIHGFSELSKLAVLLGLSFCAEGIGGLTATPLIGNFNLFTSTKYSIIKVYEFYVEIRSCSLNALQTRNL